MDLSPLDAFYFVIATVTTTGFGDISLIDVDWHLKLYGTLMMFIGAGMLAILFALVAEYFITARIETLLGRRDVDLRGHVIVVGLSRIGYRVAQALGAFGEAVAAVDMDESGDNVAAARRQMPVVIGNPSRTAVLARAGVEHAKALIAATDDPMRNIAVALQARERNPALVTVVRGFEAMTSRLGDLRFDALLSTSAVAAPMFADAALRRDVLASFTWDDRDVLVFRWKPRTESDVTTEDDALLRSITATGGEAPARLAPVLVYDGDGIAPRLVRPGERLAAGRPLVALRLRDA
jgi:voltage-gated potassium channel Kch